MVKMGEVSRIKGAEDGRWNMGVVGCVLYWIASGGREGFVLWGVNELILVSSPPPPPPPPPPPRTAGHSMCNISYIFQTLSITYFRRPYCCCFCRFISCLCVLNCVLMCCVCGAPGSTLTKLNYQHNIGVGFYKWYQGGLTGCVLHVYSLLSILLLNKSIQ